MPGKSFNLQQLFLICITFVTTVFCLFTFYTSQFDLQQSYQIGGEANINQNYPNIHQLTFHYWGSRSIVNPESALYEMKYGQSIFYEKLPSWGNRNLLKQTNKARYKAFDQRITDSDYKEFVEILNVFQAICDKNNLTFMLYGGSLLGSYRHFGVIPWDDDIDVFINRSEKSRLLNMLTNTSSYIVDSPHKRQWKFFKKPEFEICTNGSSCSANILYERHINWPYIDIFFFAENDTHIWDETPMYSSTYVYPKSDVFPLTVGLFEHLVLPVPKCTGKILSKTYNTDLCVTSIFSHKHERQSEDKQISMPCKRLYNFFPFVFEIVKGHTVFRKLILNGNLLYETVSRNSNCGNI
ncbi:uncharacterized protein LOC123566594 [Mercenaria mercenaria]|uniref:uncharacterized protein LOC123566594 n=1 Tax=Mercenaria mercenaria TaxID=6596 RepID=UPI00234ECE52|nr:uncharacterized protein LOC123566594 [Mercenaria mercenaria]